MGLLSQIGVKEEAAYGTAVVVDRFFEFDSESLERRNRTIESSAIRAAGRKLRRGSRRALVGRDGGGTVNLAVGPDLFGIWFKHALGAVATAQPDAAGNPTVYEHTFTLGDLTGKSLTIQKGVEADDGTVEPFTLVGSKVVGWELGIDVDGFATFQATIDARDVITSQALAAASFVEGNLFHFAQAELQLGGAPVAQVLNARVNGENPMKTDKYYLGSAGLKAEPRDNGFPTVGGQLEAEFVDRATFYDVYAADTAVALVLTFVGDVISGAFNEELRVTIPEIRLGGQTPQVSGPEVPRLTVPFSGFDDGASEGITVLLRNADSTP